MDHRPEHPRQRRERLLDLRRVKAEAKPAGCGCLGSLQALADGFSGVRDCRVDEVRTHLRRGRGTTFAKEKRGGAVLWVWRWPSFLGRRRPILGGQHRVQLGDLSISQQPNVDAAERRRLTRQSKVVRKQSQMLSSISRRI
jgi:hypothetical protein